MSQSRNPSLPLDTALSAHLTATLRTLRILRANSLSGIGALPVPLARCNR